MVHRLPTQVFKVIIEDSRLVVTNLLDKPVIVNAVILRYSLKPLSYDAPEPPVAPREVEEIIKLNEELKPLSNITIWLKGFESIKSVCIEFVADGSQSMECYQPKVEGVGATR